MAFAAIKLVNEKFMSEFYIRQDQVATALRLYKDGWYRFPITVNVPGFDGEAVAEEIFDLTNNPSRQSECVERYGQQRNVSVGDIVEVDGQNFLCMSEGWAQLEIESKE